MKNVYRISLILLCMILEVLSIYFIYSISLTTQEYIIFTIIIISFSIYILSKFKLSNIIRSIIIVIMIIINFTYLFKITLPKRQVFLSNLNIIKNTFTNIYLRKNEIKEIHIFKGENYKIIISNRKIIEEFVLAIKTSYELNSISSKMINYYQCTFIFQNNDKYSFYYGKDMADTDCSDHKYNTCNILYLIDIPEIDAFDNDRWPDIYRFTNFECDELVPFIKKYVDKNIENNPENKLFEI